MKTDWIAGLLGPWSAELTLGSIFLRLAVSMALAALILTACAAEPAAGSHHRLRALEQAALGRSSHVYPCEPRGHGHDAH